MAAAGAPIAPGDTVENLAGLVVPGFADAHSHVFHRALRGRTHNSGGTFWTWRDLMYSLADRLDPDTLRDLAFATYVEMVCAGYTAVGEFHYLHHQPGGGRYSEPNAMGLAVADAAQQAGIDLTLLDVAYLAGGFGTAVSAVQQRFSDGTVQNWRERVEELAGCRGSACGSASPRIPSGPFLSAICRWWPRPPSAARCTPTCPNSRRRTRLRSPPPG